MDTYPQNSQIILASASKTRTRLLQEAGISFLAIPSHIDEKRIKMHHPDMSASDLALLLATAKAQELSAIYPDALVIGCDQTLECNGQKMDKPENLEEVYNSIHTLSGQVHYLMTAVVAMKNKQCLWAFTDKNRLKIRPLSSEEITRYVQEKGQGVIGCLGGFKIEESLDLFEEINGDISSIRGIPMKQLIDFLEKNNFIKTKE